MQCFSPIPGVSRSGTTISAGLFLDFGRAKTIRLSFFLGIPALVAADALGGISNLEMIDKTVGWGSATIEVIVSLVVSYPSVAWLLKFVPKHSFNVFVIYRLVVGGLIACYLLAGMTPVV